MNTTVELPERKTLAQRVGDAVAIEMNRLEVEARTNVKRATVTVHKGWVNDGNMKRPVYRTSIKMTIEKWEYAEIPA